MWNCSPSAMTGAPGPYASARTPKFHRRREAGLLPPLAALLLFISVQMCSLAPAHSSTLDEDHAEIVWDLSLIHISEPTRPY